MMATNLAPNDTPLACEIPASGPARALAQTIASAVPVLETGRLRLRAPVTEDFALFHDILRGPRGIHFGKMSREEAWLDFAQMVAGWVLRGHGVWTIEARDNAMVFGFVLLGLDQEDPEPELGYLLSADAEGHGIAFDAARAAMDFAFETLGWSTLVSFVAPENHRSIRLAERLGGQPDTPISDPDSGERTFVYRYRGAV